MVCEAPLQRGPGRGKPATGTPAGHTRHRRAGEDPCGPCRRAHAKNMRIRHGRTGPTIAEVAVDVLQTWWPDRFSSALLVARILELHPEWSEESVKRILTRDLKDRAEWDGMTWCALAPTWMEAS